MLIEQYAALAILGTFLVAIAVSEFKERRRFPYEDVVDDIELPLHETTISSYSDKVAIGKLHNGDRITFKHRGEKRTVYLNSIQVEAGITTPVFTAADAKRDNRDVCVDKTLSLWYNEYIAVRRRSPCRRRAKLCPDPRTLRGGLPI